MTNRYTSRIDGVPTRHVIYAQESVRGRRIVVEYFDIINDQIQQFNLLSDTFHQHGGTYILNDGVPTPANIAIPETDNAE